MSNASLVASILANPRAHQVNRAEKMDKTLDVMTGNMIKKEKQLENGVNKTGLSALGYGLKHGRNTGD